VKRALKSRRPRADWFLDAEEIGDHGLAAIIPVTKSRDIFGAALNKK
jgi:hypothetical protein